MKGIVSEMELHTLRGRLLAGLDSKARRGELALRLPVGYVREPETARVLKDPNDLISFAYPALQDLHWLKELATDIHLFDATLFGAVDLTKAALSSSGVYWPALLIVTGSAVVQFYQSKQLAPNDKDARGLRAILRAAKDGKQADQQEINAAMARSTRYLLPALIFLFTINLASALSLYWLVSGIVAFIQQSIVLREDAVEMDAEADKASKRAEKAVEAEIVDKPKTHPTKKATARKKRRKK
ncbi:MAG: hypothetical protein AAB834_03700, partial [Patescibacteria group bacterium]